MPIDIAKFRSSPYKKLDKPDAKARSSVHIVRYFSALFDRVLGLIIPASIFLIFLWIWDFGLSQGTGRAFVWLVLCFFILIILTLALLFKYEVFIASAQKDKQKLSFKEDILKRRTIVLVLFFVFVFFSISSFINLELALAMGLPSISARVSVSGILAGIACLLAILYVRPNTGFVKSIFVSFFIGSTFLVLYSLIRLFFAGGYESIEFLSSQGWLLLFAVNSFLLLSFAMFQKKAVKTIWTASLLLHLVLLFAYDKPSIWIVLLIGISALLIFQIVYSKKLWQRNFTYPFQIWIIIFLLLVIPVKLFTGKTVPLPNAFEYSQVREIMSDKGKTLFGKGLSQGPDFVQKNSASFLNFEETNEFAIAQNGIEHGFLLIFIETGLFGLLVWLILILVFIISGIKFLRGHFDSLKEGDMPEEVYLGSIFWVVIIMLFIGLWFSPFSLFVYWFFMLVFGSAWVFWSKPAQSSKQEKHFYIPLMFVRICAAVIVAASAVFIIFLFRSISSASSADKLYNSSFGARESLDAWNSVVKQNPWNSEYKLRLAQAEVQTMEFPSSLDAQKQSLERVADVLRKVNDSKNPMSHWFAAKIYAQLEAYAEGSSSLSREHYKTALSLWPKNTAIPVAIAQFYRSYADSLVSYDVSASELRLESKDILRQALSIEPEYLPARLELAFILEEEQGIDLALAELEPWQESSPEIKYHVGRLYFNNADFAQASEKFAEVVREVPSHSNARYSLGISYFRLQQYDDSLTEFEEVLRLNPGNEDVQAKIDQVKEKLGISDDDIADDE